MIVCFNAAMHADTRPLGSPTPVALGLVRAGWDRLLPSWSLIAALLVFARLLAAGPALLNDPDTYLHIAAGRWILAHGTLPVHDPFSHSMPGASWVSSEWLAQIAFAFVYDEAGWSGVVLLAAAGVALAVGLLTHFMLRRWPPLIALIAVALAVAVLQPHCLARPHVLALPLLVLWSALLLGARDTSSAPPFAVVPVMALWANLHGSFLFGLAFAGFLAIEAVVQARPGSRVVEARRWGLFEVAAIAAALLTPHGLAGLEQPIRLTLLTPALQATFIEWRSPDFQQFPALELLLLGLIFVGFATGLRLPPMRLALLLGLVHMALQHVRHADLLAIVGPLAVAAPLNAGLAALAGGRAQSRLTAWVERLARPSGGPAVALALTISVALALPIMLHPLARGDDAVTPRAALAAAQRLSLSGPVLNSETFGGYLVFRGVPSFIDGRIEMYGNDFLAEDFRAEAGSEPALTRLLDRYRIAWTLLQARSGAVAVMDRLPGWEQVFADDHAIVHRRTGIAGR